MAKRTIDKAKAAKKDEFYTQLEDINNSKFAEECDAVA